MGKKRVDHHYHQANNLHGVSDHHQEESQLLHKLNTHFKKLSKTRSRISPTTLDHHHHHHVPATAAIPPSGNDQKDTASFTISMHACYGNSPSSFFDCNDDRSYRHVGGSAVVALKVGQLDYCCSDESESADATSFAGDTENAELFGGEHAFAPDLSAGHNLLHVEFVEDKNGSGFQFGVGSYPNDPMNFPIDGNGKYSSDILELSSQAEMIQEFLKENLF